MRFGWLAGFVGFVLLMVVLEKAANGLGQPALLEQGLEQMTSKRSFTT